jgi:hypothetical protein
MLRLVAPGASRPERARRALRRSSVEALRRGAATGRPTPAQQPPQLLVVPHDHDHQLRPPTPRRVALASAVGATIEWYDFFLYGTAAGLVFDKLFFNGLDGRAAQFAAFGTFAVGFLARPVGGLIFGHFRDRLGRKEMLLMTLVIMGVGTAASVVRLDRRLGADPPRISPAATRNHRDGPRNGATRRTLLDTTGPLLRPGRRGAGRCAAPDELRGAGAGGAPAAARAPRRRAGR